MVPIPARVDEDRRKPGRQPVDPLAGAGVDILARQRGEYAVAVVIFARGPAQRARQHCRRAKPRDGHGRVRRATAVDLEITFRLHLSVGLWNDLDAENLVEHEDPGTQDARRRRALGGNRH